MPIIKSVENPKQDLKAGAIIFKENSESGCFFIVKKGRVAVFKNYDSKDRVKLGVIDEGKVFGEISGFDGLPRTATAVAETDVEITKISADTLKYQLKQCPGWFRAIVMELVERLRKTDELLIEHGITHASQVSSMSPTMNSSSDPKSPQGQGG